MIALGILGGFVLGVLTVLGFATVLEDAPL